MRTLILTIVIILLSSCSYEDPFASLRGVDMLASVDPVSSWTVDSGTTFATDVEPPPSGYSQAYKLDFINLVNDGTFESGIGGWTGTIVSPAPAIFELKTDSQMTGANYLHMNLTRISGADYVSHNFNGTAGKNYTFKFDYLYIGSQDLQVSFGTTAPTDALKWNIDPDISGGKGIVNFAISTTGTYQIRFGFSQVNPLANSLDFYVDNAALFEASGQSISYSYSYPHEGIYRLKVYAKMDSSNKMTMQIGDSTESFTLNSSWQELTLDAQLYGSGNTTLYITPTVNNITEIFPGSIFITKPELYFLPDG